MWKFLVKNQSIEILEREALADHQIQYVQFKFVFDGDWKRFHKVVQFSQCDEVYSIVLGVDGTSCYLPAELHVGAAKMSVFGYDTSSDTTVRATTVPVTLNIRASGFDGEDGAPIPPTPDLYQQLLQKIEETTKGDPGKSAYQITVDHGYSGTEEEWLASLHGKDGVTPDMSEYPKTTEVQTIVETVIQPVAEDAHTHDNKAVLDAITAPYTTEDQQKLAGITPETYATTEALEAEALSIREAMIPMTRELHSHTNKAVLDSITADMLTQIGGLQQFEDSTQYEIQTINEELLTLNAQRHTHDNKAVLDSITEQYMQDQVAFQASTANALHGLSTGLSEVSAQAHSHSNKTVLDSITEQFMRDLTAFQASTANALHGLSTGLSEVSAQAHSHSNKAVLDSITEQYMQDQAAFQASTANALHGLSTGLSEVSARAHSHSNKAVLDGITQEMLDDMSSISTVVGQAHWHHNLTTLNSITESHVSRWNEAYTSAMNLNERVGANEGVFERFKTEILYDVQGNKTAITDIYTRLAAVETALSGVEDALEAIVEVN